MDRFVSDMPAVDEILNRGAIKADNAIAERMLELGREFPIVEFAMMSAHEDGATWRAALALAVDAMTAAYAELRKENDRLKQSMRTRMIGPGIHQKLTPGPRPEEVA